MRLVATISISKGVFIAKVFRPRVETRGFVSYATRTKLTKVNNKKQQKTHLRLFVFHFF